MYTIGEVISGAGTGSGGRQHGFFGSPTRITHVHRIEFQRVSAPSTPDINLYVLNNPAYTASIAGAAKDADDVAPTGILATVMTNLGSSQAGIDRFYPTYDGDRFEWTWWGGEELMLAPTVFVGFYFNAPDVVGDYAVNFEWTE